MGTYKNEPNLELNNRIFKSEWNAFTDALWKYQWLNKADMHLSDEIRECLYDLSQGILDIAVKLFVLAQINAITSGLERITIKLLKRLTMMNLNPSTRWSMLLDLKIQKNYTVF